MPGSCGQSRDGGQAAKQALPVLVDGLATPNPTLEIIALAAVGASVSAGDVPLGLLRQVFQRVSAAPGTDRLELIRAYTRISGDTGAVLAELPATGSDEPLSPTALHLVGALGPAGAAYTSRLEQLMLEQLMPDLGTWPTLGAARSHWEITGDAGPGGRALTAILAHGRASTSMIGWPGPPNVSSTPPMPEAGSCSATPTPT